MFISRPRNRKPEAVPKSWQRIENWLTQNLPEVVATLNAGASEAEIQAFENDFDLVLPDDVKESWRIHDGQQPHKSPGAIIGQPLDSLATIKSNLCFWRQLDLEEENSDHDSGLGSQCTSTPIDAIRSSYTSPGWISLGDWDGNCYGIDLNPEPNGVRGQVINFGRDEENKFVLALSWAHFLEDVADELEAGSIVVVRGANQEVDSIGRPGQDDQALFRFYKEWSEAKLPAKFQAATAVARRPQFPGKVIQGDLERGARSLVESFIAAMNAYENEWLAIRPIHKLGRRLIIESKSGYRIEGAEGVKRMPPVEKLEIHKHTQQAVRQKQDILEKFGTSRKRAMAEAFVQVYPVAYDPERQQIAEVRQVTSDYLIVYLQPIDGITTRYHLQLIDHQWLIDLKDRTGDHIHFERRSL